MGELEFGPDTDSIRAWLAKRATYTQADAAQRTAPPAGVPDLPAAVESVASEPSPEATLDRSEDVTPRTPIPDSVSAGRSVVDSLRADEFGTMPVPPAPSQAERSRVATAAQVPAAAPIRRTGASAVPQVKVSRWTEPEEFVNARHASTDVDFPVRNGVRRVLSAMLLLAVAATAVAAWFAWQEPSTGTIGVAATIALLALVVWAVRAGATTTQLAIKRGQLSVRRAGRLELVDIASPYTPVAIVGEPGLRSWRVLIERVDLPLITITPAMVDSHWFTTALYRLRPDLRPGAQAAREYDTAGHAS